MSKAKKIIHLSDLHIGLGDLEERFVHMISMLHYLKSEANNYVVVITGDVTDSASEENYRKALVCINLLRQYSHRVLIVPGNHDYMVGFWQAPGKVRIFKETFLSRHAKSYPKVDIIGEGEEDRIAFIGIDSLAGELKGLQRLGADGEIGPRQLKEIGRVLRKKDVLSCPYRVLYLHHHPLFYAHNLHGWTHDLKDLQAFQNLLLEYGEEFKGKPISALLFGHEHSRTTYPGNWNGASPLLIPRMYDGGSSTRKGDIPCIHRVIDLSRDPRFDYDGNFLRGYPIA